MESNEGQDIYFKQYIQRQENLFLDFMRKNIHLEIRVSALSFSLQDITAKYEESQKQVTIQNDLMQQAANSVEKLTIEKMNLEKRETENNKTIEDLKKNLNDCKEERKKYARQNEEMNKLYSENNQLKEKTINKNKSQATLPPDEF
jgi:predicted RNase H-like nuclease (RuvC/YqgF family)